MHLGSFEPKYVLENICVWGCLLIYSMYEIRKQKHKQTNIT
jgi:hypothetical protein